MTDVAAASSGRPRLAGHKPVGAEVQVDGGVKRETAEVIGGRHRRARRRLGALDRATTWAARSGSSGRSPTRATSTSSTTACRRSRATAGRVRQPAAGRRPRFMDEIEAGGIPVLMLRGDGRINPDGVRDYELLVPATAEALALERHAGRREPRCREAEAWRATFPSRGRLPTGPCAPCSSGSAAPRCGSTARSSGRSARAWSCSSASVAATTTRTADALARRIVRAADLRGRGGPDEPLAARRRRRGARREPVHPLRGHPPGPPAGVHRRRAAGRSPTALYERFAARSRRTASGRRSGPVRRRDGGRARQRRAVHDLARHRRATPADRADRPTIGPSRSRDRDRSGGVPAMGSAGALGQGATAARADEHLLRCRRSSRVTS